MEVLANCNAYSPVWDAFQMICPKDDVRRERMDRGNTETRWPLMLDPNKCHWMPKLQSKTVLAIQLQFVSGLCVQVTCPKIPGDLRPGVRLPRFARRLPPHRSQVSCGGWTSPFPAFVVLTPDKDDATGKYRENIGETERDFRIP